MRTFKLCAIILLILLVPIFISAQGFDLNKLKVKIGAGAQSQAPSSQPITGASVVCTKSGITLSLPAGWQIVRDEPNSLDVQGPNGMWLAIVTNDYGAGFPVEASLKAYADSAKQEKEQGKLISWQERIIDGVRGIQRVEAPMPDPDDPRRITWIGYKGTVGINIVASSKSRDFDSNYSRLDALLDSIEW